MTIAFYTLGCKVNQYETEAVKDAFLKEGFTLVQDELFADVYVINSCTVTQTADSKIRKLIRRFKRQNPLSIVALTGCFPQAFGEEALKIDGADIIMGTKNRLSLVEAVQTYSKKYIDINEHKKEDTFELFAIKGYNDKSRAFIKVQEGCDRYCAYCIIPFARGAVRSKSIKDTVTEVEGMVQNGYSEIVLSGINLSMYGKDIDSSLVSLCNSLSDIEGLKRIRLGSTEPKLVSAEDFVKLSVMQKVCPHFHIALQSGSDKTLMSMGRPYTVSEYKHIVETIREHFEMPSLTTDIIVGFPGESEEDFNETLRFVKEIGFSDVHVFPYSRRKGTKAYDMSEQVPENVKKQRVKILSQLSGEIRAEFLKSLIGTEHNVVFERTVNEYGRMGHTDNYTPIYVKDSTLQAKEIRKVRITEALKNFCLGEII